MPQDAPCAQTCARNDIIYNPRFALPRPIKMAGILFREPAETMRKCIDEAAEMLAQRVDPHIAPHDIAIPAWVFNKAKGLVFMWEYKVRRFTAGQSVHPLCPLRCTSVLEGLQPIF